MPGVGFIGIGTSSRQRRNRQTNFITATVAPATSALAAGEALQDTTNWAAFLNVGNYATSAVGETIDTIVVNYLGDTTSPGAVMADGEINHYSITVTDTGGNSRTFFTVARTVANATPVAGSLAAVNEIQSAGATLEINVASGFAGNDLIYSIPSVPWASVSGSTLSIELDDMRSEGIAITATNSGGSATVVLNVAIAPLLVTLASPIADQSLGLGSGDMSIDLRAVFANATSYSVSGTSASLEGDGYTLRLGDGQVVAAETITVTGSNTNGSITDQFTLDVVETVETALVLTIETTTPSESFALPMNPNGTYSGFVDMGDGAGPVAFSAHNDAAFTATYAGAGTHTIRLSGQIGGLRFGNDPTSAAKVRTVENLGELGWTHTIQAFDGCSGMTSFTAGNTDTSASTNWYRAFSACSALTTCDVAGISTAAATNLQQMFRGCSVLEVLDVTGFDTSNVTRMDEFTEGCTAGLVAQLDISGWNLESLSTTGGMFNFVYTDTHALSKAIYDAFLLSVAGQAITPGVFLAFGDSQPTMGGAVETARTAIINSGVSIEDNENAPPAQMAAPSLVVDSDTQIEVTLAADPFTNGLPIFTRDIRYSTDMVAWSEITSVTSPYVLTGLTDDTTCFVQSRANNFDGNGTWSNSSMAVTNGNAPPESTIITIAAGTVAEDMTGFPVLIDMADMSGDLWSALRSDGGNLRATNAADTVSYPLDIVWINAAFRTGSAFVRRNLAAGADTTIVLRTRSSSTVAASVTAPDGRNAVWTDYLSVLAFPEKTDRTGTHTVTQTATGVNRLIDTQESPDIQMHQGIAWDGTHWYVTDTDQIQKYDASWTLIATNNTPNSDTGILGVNHLGDPCIVDGELYIPVEAWPSGPFTNQHIGVFNTSDLSFKRSYDISAQGREASSFAVNPEDGFIYVTDFVDGASIPYFSTTGVYQGLLTLSQTVTNIQGMVWNGDGSKFYLSSDTSDQLFEVAADGTVGPDPLYVSAYGGAFEGLEMKDGVLHVLIDATPSAVYSLSQETNTANIQNRVQNGYLRVNDIAAQSVWTVSASVTPESFVNGSNEALASVVRKGAETNRATAALRATSSPNQYSAWNNTDGWMAPGIPVVPSDGSRVRYALGHNGTTERKIVLDGAVYATDSPVAAKPGGAEMYLYVGAEDGAPSEWLDARVGYVFLHDSYRTDNWLAAEYDNLHDTANFYAVEHEGGGSSPVSMEGDNEDPLFLLDNSVDDATAVPVSYDGTTYNDDYLGATITAGMLRAGPVRLTRPSLTGPTGLGDTVTVAAGVLVYAGDDPGDQTWQIQADGEDIAGATAETFVITGETQGTDLTVDETYDGVTVSSDALSIPSASSPTFIARDTDVGPDTNGTTANVTFSVNVGGAVTGKRVYIMTGGFCVAEEGHVMTVDGVVAARLGGRDYNDVPGDPGVEAWYVDSDTMAGEVDAVLSGFTNAHLQMAIQIVAVGGASSQTFETQVGVGVATTDITVANNDALIVAGYNSAGFGSTIVGVTEQFDFDTRTDDHFEGGDAFNLTAETDRTISITNTGTTAQVMGVIKVS